jgi:hypothetical protein
MVTVLPVASRCTSTLLMQRFATSRPKPWRSAPATGEARSHRPQSRTVTAT